MTGYSIFWEEMAAAAAAATVRLHYLFEIVFLKHGKYC